MGHRLSLMPELPRIPLPRTSVNNEQEKGGDSLPLGRYTRTYQLIRHITTLKARTPVPIISKASATSGVKETAPPVSVSAEALLLAVAVALGVAVALALVAALAAIAPLAIALAIALAGIGGQLIVGSNSVWGSVPKSTLPSGLK